MAGIRGRDTKPELAVRRYLHRRGFRYRLHDRRLPGRPDLVLRKHRVALFVHGCFWHQHPGCRLAAKPGTNAEFWQAKLASNLARDARDQLRLAELGWRSITVWECEVNALERLPDEIDGIGRADG